MYIHAGCELEAFSPQMNESQTTASKNEIDDSMEFASAVKTQQHINKGKNDRKDWTLTLQGLLFQTCTQVRNLHQYNKLHVTETQLSLANSDQGNAMSTYFSIICKNKILSVPGNRGVLFRILVSYQHITTPVCTYRALSTKDVSINTSGLSADFGSCNLNIEVPCWTFSQANKNSYRSKPFQRK